MALVELTAPYSMESFSYNISKNNVIENKYIVMDKTGRDGTDSLNNIEYLQFSDVSINLTIQN